MAMSENTWGILVTLYLYLAGLGAGSFRLAVLMARKREAACDSYADIATMLAPAALAFGLLMLIFDLKYKSRFWLTMTVLNYRSPMSIGVWLLTLFFAVSVVHAYFRFDRRLPKRISLAGRLSPRAADRFREISGLAGVPLALLVSIYTGVLLAVTNVLMWRNLALPALFAISAFATGFACAAAIAGLYCRPKMSSVKPLRLLLRSYRFILPVYLAAAIAYSLLPPMEGGWTAGAAAHPRGWYALVWWLGVVGLGIAVPYVMVLGREDLGPRRAAVLFACLLAGGFLLRLVLIYAGQAQVALHVACSPAHFIIGGLL